jgi:hypothetical protein
MRSKPFGLEFGGLSPCHKVVLKDAPPVKRVMGENKPVLAHKFEEVKS